MRIFLGSERQQFRAERVFLWSVEKHRDPSRIYEIHLLKGLQGYISGFWITGFTNYRFAIPHFCNYIGRAIYNDVDQVWLSDPAELFDRDIGSAGFLSINDHDSSVMLIDCQRMAGVWNHDKVVGTTRKRIEARARAASLWGEMPSRYNARDAEYRAGESACVHFTTLHTQPWRPFPDQFVYDRNPTGDLWFDLEREADQARFLPVSSLRPSSSWPDFALALSAQPHGPELIELLGPKADKVPHLESRTIRCLLECVPDGDLPWVIDRLFSRSSQLEVNLREPVLISKRRPRRSLHFWIEQFELASRLNPQTRWRLTRRVGPSRRVLTGGPLRDGPVVVLSQKRSDSRRTAGKLGASLARQGGRALVHAELPGGFLRSFRHASSVRQRVAENHRPALLIASGTVATGVAHRIAKQSDYPPALVLLGRHAGRVPEHAGIALSMDHHGLPAHPNRLTMLCGLEGESLPTPAPKLRAWKKWRKASRRSALLVGGKHHGAWKTSELKTLFQDALGWSRRRNARLLIITCRDSAHAGPRLQQLARREAAIEVFSWQPDAGENPYAMALEKADALLVAGASPQLLRDALASPAPTWLVPDRRTPGVAQKLAAGIAKRAFRPRYNKRGSIRPQQGLGYLCARLIERGWVLPPAGISAWHNRLVDAGLAAWLESDAGPANRVQPQIDALGLKILEKLDPAITNNRTHASTAGHK
ncbi:MAG: ELM1/GtrOC1 family putative glycosyltransferase [Wenzhouxiangellaceae bacterium]|nr:ELM1/GtrOC1 family putative glycosyltransferase [Wenzhouxiangellaceae bacterium]